jgi:hypothetical protein
VQRRRAPSTRVGPDQRADVAWLALDALLDAAEAREANTLEPPWWQARAAGEGAIYARSAVDVERACATLRSLIAGA